jgi:ABC-2 type transport system permease protein
MPADAAVAVLAAGRRLGAVARHQVVLLRRSPGQVIVYTVMPVVLTVLLEPTMAQLARHPDVGTGTAAFEAGPGARAGAGTLVLGSLFMAGVVGAGMVDERIWGTAERLRSTPTRPLEVLVGKALPMLGVLLAQQVVVFSVATALYPTGTALARSRLAAVGFAWAVFVLGLGALMAAVVTTSAQLSTLKDLTALVLSGTGGAVVPLTALPAWISPVAPFSPAYWAMSGYLDEPGTPGTAVVLLAGTGLVMFAMAAIALPRRTLSS